jgi:hypothetical protein
MSVFTGLGGVRVSVADGDTTGEIPGYSRTYNPHVLLSKTIDGSLFEVECQGFMCGGPQRITWGGFNYVNATDPGTGFQAAYNIVPTSLYPMNGGNFSTLSGFFKAPVEDGNILGGVPDICASDLLETWIRDDNLAIITTWNPANWGDMTDTISPTPLTTTRLSGFVTRTERIIGLDGNDHILQQWNSILTPNGDYSGFPQALYCDNTVYGPGASFTICKSVNLNDGSTTVVTPPSDGTLSYSQTQPRMWTNAGGTQCFAVYSPLSLIGANGFLGGRKSLLANSFHFRSVEPIIPGALTVPVCWCWGNEATTIAALLQCKGKFP